MINKVGLDDYFAAGHTVEDLLKCQRLDIEDLSSDHDGGNDSKPSQATLLVEIAVKMYGLGIDQDGSPYLVAHERPSVALMFRGSETALKTQLSAQFRRTHEKVPNSSALKDALTALEGMAADCEPRPVFLRVAHLPDGTIVLDLGRRDGKVVIASSMGWKVTNESPVLFRRTALTGETPVPHAGGSLGLLEQFLNITEESWFLLLGWLVAALMEDIPHAILLLMGEKATGKTTFGCICIMLVDPSPAPVRSPPRDARQWAITTSASWGFVVDNISRIHEWWSDALCKASTGDGWVDRALFTDSDISFLRFRRVIALTSIDPGALRGDLADRLLSIELEPIPKSARRPEKEMLVAFGKQQPLILGALLDLTCRVLHELPAVNERELPRMADFGRVLSALDRVLGCNSLRSYIKRLGQIERDVLDDDPVASMLMKLLERSEGGIWSGTATDLLSEIRPADNTSDWPKTGRGLVGALKRAIPALRSVGVMVKFSRSTGRNRTRLVTASMETQSPGPGSANDPKRPAGQSTECGRSGDDDGRSADGNRPHQKGSKQVFQSKSDGADGLDGCSPYVQDGPFEGDQSGAVKPTELTRKSQDSISTVQIVRTVQNTPDQPADDSLVGRLPESNRPPSSTNRPQLADGAYEGGPADGADGCVRPVPGVKAKQAKRSSDPSDGDGWEDL